MAQGGLRGDGYAAPKRSRRAQGGVIGPLLMNIALHGMEEALGVRYDKRGQIKGSRALVRYADDWVVFCESEEDAQEDPPTGTIVAAKERITPLRGKDSDSAPL